MRTRLFCTAATLSFLLATAGAARAQSDADAEAPAEDPVVATVNGEELRRSDVAESASSLPPAYQQNIDQIFPALVDRLIDLRLLSAEARERNLAEDETVRELVAEFENEAIREVFLQRYLEEKLTDEAIEQRYEQQVAEFEPQPEIRARHILVENKEQAEEVITELEGGADFAEVAKTKSVGPSAPDGGDLGYFTADQMVPEFAEAALALETGEVSKEPVQTQFGWHVIKVEDRRETQPPSLEEARPEIESALSQELVTALLQDLREDAEIEKFEAAMPPAEAPSGDDATGAPAADQPADGGAENATE